MKTVLSSTLLILGIFGIVASGGDLLTYDPDISGKIVDYDTREPVEGAVVSCVWFHDQFRLTAASKKEFYDYFETVTGRDGRFRIPGKGLCILRNIYPPSISILKAGFSVLYFQNLAPDERQVLPSSGEVNWSDGKAIVLFREKPPEDRIRTLKSHSVVPIFQMMRDGVPPEKVRLYVRELEKEYKAAGMEENKPLKLKHKNGGVFSAGERAIEPKSTN